MSAYVILGTWSFSDRRPRVVVGSGGIFSTLAGHCAAMAP
jgi:hypothetical protein